MFIPMKPSDPKTTLCDFFDLVINHKDISVCDRLIAEDYVDHDAPEGTPPGPGSVKEYLGVFLGDYPDLQVVIYDLVAEGDRVAARAEWYGSHKETEAIYHREGMVLVRCNAQGQLAERWSIYRELGATRS